MDTSSILTLLTTRWKRTLGASRRCVNASLKHLSDALLEEDQSDTADADAAWPEAAHADVETNEEDKLEDERDENAALRAERGGKAESSTSGFMEWYMSKFTDSFAEELDSIRSKVKDELARCCVGGDR